MDLECTVSFYSPSDSTLPLHRYRVIAKPGPEAGSAVAEARPEMEPKAQFVAQTTMLIAHVDEGGLEAALNKLVAILAERHLGLNVFASESRPRQRPRG